MGGRKKEYEVSGRASKESRVKKFKEALPLWNTHMPTYTCMTLRVTEAPRAQM